MKTAVIFYSLNGNTRYVADKVAKDLAADLIELIPVKAYPDKGMIKFIWGGSAVTFKKKPDLEPYEFDKDKYELLILATPVWASSFAPPLRTFLDGNDLSGKKIAVITCCAGGKFDKCVDGLKELAKADSLAAQLNLVEPKGAPSDEKEKQIAEFIETCKGLA